ncbi:hypothetical protein GLW08_03355 [Pontibacillus yanchengensis]|uniref:Uncharacterized protein n=2 Tax=Pontibacillus yanchengensis TaxID=462910 RepID=A0ACC7VBU5_9BACI|nr:hypothetical protein [Pontibacillus yanchengensis]MYL52371.1 hypothetical protein [Pontibacillus yanchengensis]
MKKLIMTSIATILIGLGFAGTTLLENKELHAQTLKNTTENTDAANVSENKTNLDKKTSTVTYINEQEKKAVQHASSQKGQAAQSKQKTQSNKTITMEATAYTANCAGCSGVTRTGINLKANPNQKVIAVDPNVIPLGTKVHVEGYGTAVAGDIGSDIQGNRIDVFIPSRQNALDFGRKQVKVTILS